MLAYEDSNSSYCYINVEKSRCFVTLTTLTELTADVTCITADADPHDIVMAFLIL